MMKVMISYFYKVRFFTRNMIPFSTAVWDPKWYHNFRGSDYIFQDKRGVINGVRVPGLSPAELTSHGCSKECLNSPDKCSFIHEYTDYLNSLDFKEVITCLEDAAKTLRKVVGFEEEPVVVLLVHEAPSNPCSERGPLIEYFRRNGVELEEFDEKQL